MFCLTCIIFADSKAMDSSIKVLFCFFSEGVSNKFTYVSPFFYNISPFPPPSRIPEKSPQHHRLHECRSHLPVPTTTLPRDEDHPPAQKKWQHKENKQPTFPSEHEPSRSPSTEQHSHRSLNTTPQLIANSSYPQHVLKRKETKVIRKPHGRKREKIPLTRTVSPPLLCSPPPFNNQSLCSSSIHLILHPNTLPLLLAPNTQIIRTIQSFSSHGVRSLPPKLPTVGWERGGQGGNSWEIIGPIG